MIFLRRKKGKYFEKENIFFVGGEEKRRSKRKTIFGKRKYIFVAAKKNREGKGGKYFMTSKSQFGNSFRRC